MNSTRLHVTHMFVSQSSLQMPNQSWHSSSLDGIFPISSRFGQNLPIAHSACEISPLLSSHIVEKILLSFFY